MTWDILVSRIENGFLLTHEDWESETISEEAIVVDIDGFMTDEEERAKLGEALCWAVINHFDLRGSRHDKHRVTVSIEHGDKYMGDEVDSIQ